MKLVYIITFNPHSNAREGILQVIVRVCCRWRLGGLWFLVKRLAGLHGL